MPLLPQSHQLWDLELRLPPRRLSLRAPPDRPQLRHFTTRNDNPRSLLAPSSLKCPGNIELYSICTAHRDFVTSRSIFAGVHSRVTAQLLGVHAPLEIATTNRHVWASRCPWCQAQMLCDTRPRRLRVRAKGQSGTDRRLLKDVLIKTICRPDWIAACLTCIYGQCAKVEFAAKLEIIEKLG